MRTKQGGFTLLELVITLIILGIMLGMGIPAMSKMIQSTGVRQAANTLVRDFNIARSQASDLNQNITMCRRKTGGSNECRGAGTGDGWNTVGWVIFVDANSNDIPDVAGEFIRITDPITTASIDLNAELGNVFDGVIRFAPDGTVRDSVDTLAQVNIDICPRSSGITGRTVDMNSRGNIRTSIAVDELNGRGCP